MTFFRCVGNFLMCRIGHQNLKLVTNTFLVCASLSQKSYKIQIMINQQELEAKIIELSLWSRGSFGKSCFYGQLLVDLSSFNWNKYDGLEQICRLRNLVASSSLF